MLRRYFAYVSIVEGIIVNTIFGFILSPIFGVGVLVFLTGEGIFDPPTWKSFFQGCIIMFIIFCGFLVENYIMYRICRRIRGVPLESVDRKQLVLQTIIVAVAFLCAVSFLIILILIG